MFRNVQALTHDWVPPKLPYREEQYNMIKNYLKVIDYGLTPPHMLLLGPVGTGKTITMRKIISELPSSVRNNVIYVVSGRTSYETLVYMTENLVGKRLWGYSFSEVWSIFDKCISTPTIVVIDEIDKMIIPGKGDELLYYLSRRSSTTIIAISNRLNVYDYIRDQRVKSSFTPRIIFFPQYEIHELKEILRLRVEEAFQPSVVDDGVIEYIAALAYRRGGDARYAIDLLRAAAEIAIRKGDHKIVIEHVDLAKEEVEVDYIAKGVLNLKNVHKLLLKIIVDNGSLTISEVVDRYNKLAPEYGLSTLSSRRISDYLAELELLGLIKIVRKGMGRGGGVRWIVQIADGVDKEVLQRTIETTLQVSID